MKTPALALAALLMLSACQPPTYDVIVTVRGGALVLTPQPTGSWPFGWGMDAIYAYEVSIADEADSRIVIDLQHAQQEGAVCQTEDQHVPYPLTIRRNIAPPPCWTGDTSRFGLVRGHRYRINAHGLRHGMGWFRVESDMRITNIDYEGNVRD